MSDREHTLVVGGGVIGIACAHSLSEAGFRVTVVDRARIGEACSYRNCGLVCPSHVLPLAMPGAIASALKAMTSRGGAFRIRPRLDPRLWRWLWNFARRCNRSDMLAAGRAIQPLLKSSLEMYRELVSGEEIDCEWQERGLLFVYRDRAALDAYEPESELLASEFDERARRLDTDELLELEPGLKDGLAGAWYFESDAHLRPERLLSSWRSSLERRGVRFVESWELRGLRESAGNVVAADGGDGVIEADRFVIATGAWTPRLARILRCRVPIEPGKGYSVMLPRPESCPRIPMIFPEHRVAVTPLEAGIRLGSIMELSGWDESLLPGRLRLLSEGAAHYLRDPIAERVSQTWYGWRPMTYDTVPVIGACPGFSNVFLATGHNMLGLSMAPATGRLVAELLTGTAPHVPPAPYSAERFKA